MDATKISNLRAGMSRHKIPWPCRMDRRVRNDPDETEGRMIYRAHAEAEARASCWRDRKITLMEEGE